MRTFWDCMCHQYVQKIPSQLPRDLGPVTPLDGSSSFCMRGWPALKFLTILASRKPKFLQSNLPSLSWIFRLREVPGRPTKSPVVDFALAFWFLRATFLGSVPGRPSWHLRIPSFSRPGRCQADLPGVPAPGRRARKTSARPD